VQLTEQNQSPQGLRGPNLQFGPNQKKK
jgi:hypothetical protein